MSYTQTGRRLSVTTPLGKDFLILNGFTGHEAISRPFSFQLQCIAENAKKVPFESLLGQKVTVEISLPGGSKRWINGVCLRVAQGGRDEKFTSYVLDLVPAVFLLSRKTQSRIFQQKKIPDILKEVLKGVEGLVVTQEIQGTFEPRDYCVQYRESDFAFASRLMEEEGLYYFFTHSDGAHKMVVTDKSQPEVSPGKSNLIFDAVAGGTREEDRVQAWEKMQELRSSKVMLWDHCFELPHKHLEAPEAPVQIQASVAAGKSSHKLQLKANAPLELYDFPGAYAQRFDGINKGGGEQAEIQKIFKDNTRTTDLRAQAEAAASVLVHGASNCRQLVSGHRITLERHFEGDGSWVLYEIDHLATEAADVRSGRGGFSYQNHFSCFPAALPFRPPRVTPVPTVRGTQTAVVVGPKGGEEIYTDKYGRVKVQFHWDREGKSDTDSSCWVRVATPWAGQRWGAIHIPRIGQEVVVDFLEGDMDQPIVIGSVYNAECMPPYDLPANKTQSGIKSRSSLGGGPPNFNEIRFEDKKGHEVLTIHAERNQSISVEADESHSVGHDRTKTIDHDETTHVKHDRTETVDHDETTTIMHDRTESVVNNEIITIGVNRTELVGSNEVVTIGANRTETVGSNEVVTIGAVRTETIGAADVLTVGAARIVTVGAGEVLTVGDALVVTAGSETTLTVGASILTMKKDGSIEVSGEHIKVTGSDSVTIGVGSNSIKVSTSGIEITGAKVDIAAIGTATISGALVKINC